MTQIEAARQGTITPEMVRAGKKLKWTQIMSAGVETVLFKSGGNDLRDSNIVLTNNQIVQGPEIADHFHVDRGEIEGIDVSGKTVVVLADTPALMSEGNWRVGVVMDATASPEQAEKLGAVFSGQSGGPMAMLSPLISEMLGVVGVLFLSRVFSSSMSVRI